MNLPDTKYLIGFNIGAWVFILLKLVKDNCSI